MHRMHRAAFQAAEPSTRKAGPPGAAEDAVSGGRGPRTRGVTRRCIADPPSGTQAGRAAPSEVWTGLFGNGGRGSVGPRAGDSEQLLGETRALRPASAGPGRRPVRHDSETP